MRRQLDLLYDNPHFCILNCTIYTVYLIGIGDNCIVWLIQIIIIIIIRLRINNLITAIMITIIIIPNKTIKGNKVKRKTR